MNIYVSWIDKQDLLLKAKKPKNIGPVASLLISDFSSGFDEVYLLHNFSDKEIKNYENELLELLSQNGKKLNIKFIHIDLKDPTDIKDIYSQTDLLLDSLNKKARDITWHFHISPGTKYMSIVLILLGKTKYPATFYKAWIENDIQKTDIIDIPFELALDFVQRTKDILTKENIEFDELKDIKGKSKEIKKIKEDIAKLAIFDIPVLILGESGTGKEITARAIHNLSRRRDKPFIAINCAAIPKELFESELFGYSKGAFTGATTDKAGKFEAAEGGTIFLDEVAELEQNVQAKLLRVLQENEILSVGSNRTKKINVRIIAATNKDIINIVKEGKFREDLLYRLHIGKIVLPPLRERKGDAIILAKEFIEEINKEFYNYNKFYKPKKLDETALEFIKNYHWYGNIRELQNVLKAACIFCDKHIISAQDLQQRVVGINNNEMILTNNIEIPESGINLERYIYELKTKYIKKALEKSKNKEEAAQLLGYKSYQTMDNQLKKKFSIK